LYHYRAYQDTLLTYGTDAATIHLTNSFWYLDGGNMLACDPKTNEATNNKGFTAWWNRCKQSKELEMCGLLHNDICNVPLYLLPGVRLQIKLNKARSGFFLMHKDATSKVQFKFIGAQLLVHRIKPNPSVPLAHNTVLHKGGLTKYNFTRAELKTFPLS
jgi:hypothetical protein